MKQSKKKYRSNKIIAPFNEHVDLDRAYQNDFTFDYRGEKYSIFTLTEESDPFDKNLIEKIKLVLEKKN